MKLLWHSNAPEPLSQTGYGVQTGLFAKRIAKLGHDVVISCMTGISGFPTEQDGITCLPGGLTAYSGDILPEHARHFFGRDPGLVLLHFDVWAIHPDSLQGLASACWSPVHSVPMSLGDRAFYGRSGAQPIAYSRFGEQQMRDAGLSPAYVPHGVDTEIFRPLDDGERAAVRRHLGVPEDAFVIAMVAANKGNAPSRKAFAETFEAFARFRKTHPEAVLLLHTLAATPDGYGVDMRPLIEHLGIGRSVIFTDEYAQVTGLYPSSWVAGLTGCADVVAQPSYGEGFGLSALQAQACGVPVITGDNTAQAEINHAGWKVAGQHYWHEHDQANWFAPSIDGIHRAMVKAYDARASSKAWPRLQQRAREFALGYDADLVTEKYWRPVLDMLEQYAGAAPVRSQRGAEVPLPVTEADGLKWITRGPHTDDWITVGHEEALAGTLHAMLPDGGTFLDVGAHAGRWSLRLAARAGKVIAVEPNPPTIALLRAHIDLNQVGNVEVLEVAAWDTATRVRLDDENHRVQGGSTRALADDEGTIEAMPLDSLDRRRADPCDQAGCGRRGPAGAARHGRHDRPLPPDDADRGPFDLRPVQAASADGAARLAGLRVAGRDDLLRRCGAAVRHRRAGPRPSRRAVIRAGGDQGDPRPSRGGGAVRAARGHDRDRGAEPEGDRRPGRQ